MCIRDRGEEAYADFKTMDIGDILGVVGKVFKMCIRDREWGAFSAVLMFLLH